MQHAVVSLSFLFRSHSVSNVYVSRSLLEMSSILDVGLQFQGYGVYVFSGGHAMYEPMGLDQTNIGVKPLAHLLTALEFAQWLVVYVLPGNFCRNAWRKFGSSLPHEVVHHILEEYAILYGISWKGRRESPRSVVNRLCYLCQI